MPSPAAPPPPRRLAAEAAAVFSALAALYAATRSANLAISHDSLGYVLELTSGDAAQLLNPHHVLYGPLGAAWLGAARALGAGGDAAGVLALLSAVGGGVAGALAYALLRGRAGLPRGLALAGTAAAAVSYGFWYYSVCVEVYLPPLALLLGTLYVLLGPRPTAGRPTAGRPTAGRPTAGRAAAAGALHGVAVLGHQAHVLFGVVALVVLWRRRADAAAFVRTAAAFTAVGAGLTLAGYAAAIATVVEPLTPEAAWLWTTKYAQTDFYWHGPSLPTLARAAVGFARSVVGGQFGLVFEPVRAGLGGAFGPGAVVDEAFLVRGLSPGVAAVLLAGAVGVGIALLALLVRGLRRRTTLGPGPRDLAVACAVWIGVYAAFFTFWDSNNAEFWIPQATALWLLVAALNAPRPDEPRVRRATVVLGVTAAILFAVNLVGTVLPATDPANDLCRSRVGPVAALAGPGDLVVVDRANVVDRCATYFAGAEGVSYVDALTNPYGRDPFAMVRAEVEAARARGGRVVFAPQAVRPDAALRDFTGAAALAARVRAAYGGRWTARPAGSATIYVLEPGR